MLKNYYDFINDSTNIEIDESEYLDYLMFLENIDESNINEFINVSKFGDVWNIITSIATKVGIAINEVISIFKNKFIFGILKNIGFSFVKLYELLKTAWKTFIDFRESLFKFIAKHPLVKNSSEYAKWLDEFISTNPFLKTLGGVALAYFLFYIWTSAISFTGDPDFDFNISDMWDALIQKKGFADIFGNENGVKMLTFILTNKLAGLTFPWPGSTSAQFIFAIIYTLGVSIGKKMTKYYTK